MPDVTDNQRIAAENLPASAEARNRPRLRYRLRSRGGQPDDGKRGTDCAQIHFLTRTLKIQRADAVGNLEVLGKIQGTANRGGDAFKHRLRLRIPAPHQGRHTGLENSGLFGGDFGPGIAKQSAMVQANRSDDAYFGSNDVGTVQTASKSGFYDGDIHAAVGKPFESHARSDFEERQAVTVIMLHKVTHRLLRNHNRLSRWDLVSVRGTVVARDHVNGRGPARFGLGGMSGAKFSRTETRSHRENDFNPFAEIKDVRRSVKSCTEAACSKGGGQHGTNRPLSVCPGNMNAAKIPLRVPQRRGIIEHLLQPRLIRLGTEARRLHAPVSLEEPLNHATIIHQSQESK